VGAVCTASFVGGRSGPSDIIDRRKLELGKHGVSLGMDRGQGHSRCMSVRFRGGLIAPRERLRVCPLIFDFSAIIGGVGMTTPEILYGNMLVILLALFR